MKSGISKFMLVLLLVFSTSSFVFAADIDNSKTLIKIVLQNPVATDGDTIRDGDIRIRLWGIDAPEKGQKCLKQGEEYSCGMTAKLVLSKLLEMDKVECQKVAIDRYNRIVAICKIGPFDISREMVNMGWAFDYTLYSKGYYKQYEEVAHKKKLGIWEMTFDKPSDWRKGHRTVLRSGSTRE